MKVVDILKKCKSNLDNLTIEEFKRIIEEKKLDEKEYNFFNYKDDNFAILSKTNCNQLECDYNSNGICVRVGLRGDNKGKIGICWQDWGKGEY